MIRILAGLIASFIVVASTAQADDFETIKKYCSSIEPPARKVQQCSELLKRSAVSQIYTPNIHHEIAYAWFKQDQFSKAIDSTRREIDTAWDFTKSRIESPSATSLEREGLTAAMSGRYWTLGTYQNLERLRIGDDSIAARGYAKASLASFSTAISLYGRNHSALASRAELNSLFCKSALAEADRLAAIKIATAQSNEQLVRKYKLAFLPSCIPSWRD